MTRKIIRLIGIAAFLIAFFLPAIRSKEAQGGPGSGSQEGWFCAAFSLVPSVILFHPSGDYGIEGKDVFLLFSGWVNPFVLIYLLFCIWRKFIWTRRVLAAVILSCLTCTWVFLAESAFTPLIGHYLWVAGILTILAPEAIDISDALVNISPADKTLSSSPSP